MYENWEDRYVPIEEIKQGEKFTYKGDTLMKLPKHVTCYGESCDAIDLKTGTMLCVNTRYLRIDLETMQAYNIDTEQYI